MPLRAQIHPKRTKWGTFYGHLKRKNRAFWLPALVVENWNRPLPFAVRFVATVQSTRLLEVSTLYAAPGPPLHWSKSVFPACVLSWSICGRAGAPIVNCCSGANADPAKEVSIACTLQ